MRIVGAGPGLIERLVRRWPEFEGSIRNLAAEDPTGDFRWLDWGVKQLRAGASVDGVLATLRAFYAQRDVLGEPTKHKTLADAQAAVAAVKTEAEPVYDKDGWTITPIRSREELWSVSGSKPSKWCVGWDDDSHWYQYTEEVGQDAPSWQMFVVKGPTPRSPYLLYLGGAMYDEIKDRGNQDVPASDPVRAVLSDANLYPNNEEGSGEAPEEYDEDQGPDEEDPNREILVYAATKTGEDHIIYFSWDRDHVVEQAEGDDDFAARGWELYEITTTVAQAKAAEEHMNPEYLGDGRSRHLRTTEPLRDTVYVVGPWLDVMSSPKHPRQRTAPRLDYHEAWKTFDTEDEARAWVTEHALYGDLRTTGWLLWSASVERWQKDEDPNEWDHPTDETVLGSKRAPYENTRRDQWVYVATMRNQPVAWNVDFGALTEAPHLRDGGYSVFRLEVSRTELIRLKNGSVPLFEELGRRISSSGGSGFVKQVPERKVDAFVLVRDGKIALYATPNGLHRYEEEAVEAALHWDRPPYTTQIYKIQVPARAFGEFHEHNTQYVFEQDPKTLIMDTADLKRQAVRAVGRRLPGRTAVPEWLKNLWDNTLGAKKFDERALEEQRMQNARTPGHLDEMGATQYFSNRPVTVRSTEGHWLSRADGTRVYGAYATADCQTKSGMHRALPRPPNLPTPGQAPQAPRGAIFVPDGTPGVTTGFTEFTWMVEFDTTALLPAGVINPDKHPRSVLEMRKEDLRGAPRRAGLRVVGAAAIEHGDVYEATREVITQGFDPVQNLQIVQSGRIVVWNETNNGNVAFSYSRWSGLMPKAEFLAKFKRIMPLPGNGDAFKVKDERLAQKLTSYVRDEDDPYFVPIRKDDVLFVSHGEMPGHNRAGLVTFSWGGEEFGYPLDQFIYENFEQVASGAVENPPDVKAHSVYAVQSWFVDTLNAVRYDRVHVEGVGRTWIRYVVERFNEPYANAESVDIPLRAFQRVLKSGALRLLSADEAAWPIDVQYDAEYAAAESAAANPAVAPAAEDQLAALAEKIALWNVSGTLPTFSEAEQKLLKLTRAKSPAEQKHFEGLIWLKERELRDNTRAQRRSPGAHPPAPQQDTFTRYPTRVAPSSPSRATPGLEVGDFPRRGGAAAEEPRSVVVVVPIPEPLASEWPKDRGGDDDSPPHFTVAYLPAASDRADEVAAITRRVAAGTSPFELTLAEGVSWFKSDNDDVAATPWIAHKALGGGGDALEAVHHDLVQALREAGFKVSTHDTFKPHATLKYCTEESYDRPTPEGSFTADALSVRSGDDEVARVPFEDDSLREAARRVGLRVVG